MILYSPCRECGHPIDLDSKDDWQCPNCKAEYVNRVTWLEREIVKLKETVKELDKKSDKLKKRMDELEDNNSW